jgi:hypothetical protein
MRFRIADKDYVEFNPEGLTPALRFVDSQEGIDVGYPDIVEIYEFVNAQVLPAFVGFLPDCRNP